MSSDTVENKQREEEVAQINDLSKESEMIKLQQEIADLQQLYAEVEETIRSANQRREHYDEYIQKGEITEEIKELKSKEVTLIYTSRKRRAKIVSDLDDKRSQLRMLQDALTANLSQELTQRLVTITNELASNVQDYNNTFSQLNESLINMVNSQPNDEPYQLECTQLDFKLQEICSKKQKLLEQRRSINETIQQKHLNIQITINDSRIEYSREKFSSTIEFMKYLSNRDKKNGNSQSQDPDYAKQSDDFEDKASKLQLQSKQVMKGQVSVEEQSAVSEQQKLKNEQLMRQEQEKKALLLLKQSKLQELKCQFQSQKCQYKETIENSMKNKFIYEILPVKKDLIQKLKATHQKLGQQIILSKDLYEMFQDVSKYIEIKAYHQQQTVFLNKISEQLEKQGEYVEEESQIEQLNKNKRAYHQKILEQPNDSSQNLKTLTYLPEQQFYLQGIQTFKQQMSPEMYILLKMKQLSLKYQRKWIQITKSSNKIDDFDLKKYSQLLQRQISCIQQLETYKSDANIFVKIRAQLQLINTSLASICSQFYEEIAYCSEKYPIIALLKDNQDMFIDIKKKELARMRQDNGSIRKNIQNLKEKRQERQKLLKQLTQLRQKNKQDLSVKLCSNNRQPMVDIETRDEISSLLHTQIPAVQINNMEEIKQILEQMKEEKNSLESQLQQQRSKRKNLQQSLKVEEMRSIGPPESIKTANTNYSFHQDELIVKLTEEMVVLLNRCKENQKSLPTVKNQSKLAWQSRRK